MNDGMLMLTGHPCIHVGLAQSRQRRASVMACSALSPIFTSSVRVVARYTGSSSGMTTREMAVRSFGFMAFRISCRHGALRSVSSLSEVVVSIWEASAAQAFSFRIGICCDIQLRYGRMCGYYSTEESRKQERRTRGAKIFFRRSTKLEKALAKKRSLAYNI